LELTRRFAWLFREALDRVDYAVTLARCWVVDLIHGPEPPTLADMQREAEHEKLKRAFPMIGLDGTVADDKEPQTHVETSGIVPAQVSSVTAPKPEVPADRPVD
jgi:hypothetical protein